MRIKSKDPIWIGKTFNDLTVLGLGGRDKYNRQLWRCECECGNIIEALPTYLKRGDVKSCGCIKRRKPWRKYENGYGRESRIYRIWSAMKSRATNKNMPEAESYVLRGITICDEWKESYQIFLEWALANGYRDDLTLDRIDNDKGYSPDNCRWATTKEQSLNRKNTIYVEKDGEKIPLKVYCEAHSLNYLTIKSRIQSGWDKSDAIETPIFDTSKSIRRACIERGLNYHTIYSRIKRKGMTLDEALNVPIDEKRRR